MLSQESIGKAFNGGPSPHLLGFQIILELLSVSFLNFLLCFFQLVEFCSVNLSKVVNFA